MRTKSEDNLVDAFKKLIDLSGRQACEILIAAENRERRASAGVKSNKIDIITQP
jgi:hypothetical protein